jgi:two-component system, NarL family, sensor histidine kinase ComP
MRIEAIEVIGGARPLSQVIGADERFEIYRIIAENTSDTIVLVDHDSIVRFVSPSIYPLCGYTVAEYEGMDAFDVIHPEDRARARQIHAQAVEHKQTADLGYRVMHAKGHTVHIEARVKPVLDELGQVKYVVAVARDVTERKQTEQLLENILHNINAVVWSTDKDFSRYTFLSGSVEKVTGISREHVIDHPIRMHDHIHPEDNEVLMGEVKEKLDRKQSVIQDFRFNHIHEGDRWGRLIVHPWLDHAGEVERLDGIILDITEKIRSELALEESEQRFKALFENNLDGVFSVELDGFYFVNANPAFERISGMELPQLMNKCFIGMIHDEDHHSVYEALHEVLHAGIPKDLECRLDNAKHGETIVSITFVPIFLKGSLNGIHGIVKDITKRKLEERELIQSEERYKALQQSINRFSNDLANVMKVSELENRLVDEVRTVLPVNHVSIEEVPRGQEQDLRKDPASRIKIGEKGQPVFIKLELCRPLLKIEEEWLDTAIHYVTLLYDNLHLIEDLMSRIEELVTANETPKWMLRLLFQLSEKERSRLSSDLHDSVLQDLIIWYRKLESLRSSKKFEKETQSELMKIEEGLLDAIHQIRITCNELRPPFLLKMGLVESLKSLFEYARMFSNYEIEFVAEQSDVPLNEEQILAVYRIVQELLNNASKHSQAGKVTMSLTRHSDYIHFAYDDDGVGMDMSLFAGSFQHMGIAGVEKRVLSLGGQVEFHSAPQQGFHVTLQFPTI